MSLSRTTVCPPAKRHGMAIRWRGDSKVKKGANIRNRYNQAPQLIQNTNGKVTTSQLDITNSSHKVSPFPAGDHKTCTHALQKQGRNNINDPQKSTALERSVRILLEGFDQFHSAPTSP